MGIPQYIYLFFLVMGIGITMAKHGEPSGKHNFFTTLIVSCINAWILYWGGFFRF